MKGDKYITRNITARIRAQESQIVATILPVAGYVLKVVSSDIPGSISIIAVKSNEGVAVSVSNHGIYLPSAEGSGPSENILGTIRSLVP